MNSDTYAHKLKIKRSKNNAVIFIKNWHDGAFAPLHLPDQVAEMGPIHKSSAFAGEGAFLLYGQHFNDTVNICNQIVNKLNLKSENNKFFKTRRNFKY